MKNTFRFITGLFFSIIIFLLAGSIVVLNINNPFIGIIFIFFTTFISFKLGFKITNRLFKYEASEKDDFIKYIEEKERLITNNNYDTQLSQQNNLSKQYDINKINTPKYTDKIYDEFVVLDFETTGLFPDTDKIIEVSILKYKNNIKVDEFHTLINPKIKIPAKITKINGITNDMVKDKPTIEEILPKLLDFIGYLPIVAHNASFDAKFLKCAVLFLYGEDIINNEFIDTVKIARQIYPNLPNHKLVTIKEYLGFDLESHRAYEDTLVTAQIYLDYTKSVKTLPKQKKEPNKSNTEPSSFSELDFPLRSQNEKPGYYQDKHHTDYVDLVKQLKRVGEYSKAERLLLALIDAIESESKKENWGIPPWYYEQLAIIYRKQKNLLKELEILERYYQQKKGIGPGEPHPKLLERLEKVRRKMEIN